VYLLSVTGLSACKDVRLYDASSCPLTSPAIFYKLREIERPPLRDTCIISSLISIAPSMPGSVVWKWKADAYRHTTGSSMSTSQTVPPLPLLWWGVRPTLPCKPQPNEKPRCETKKATVRALLVCP
jgi:hypothetical protein